MAVLFDVQPTQINRRDVVTGAFKNSVSIAMSAPSWCLSIRLVRTRELKR
jgi:hypothetical protein